jgi:3-deoxy-D-manno-octulosonate 8-phosphate phosphatase (KDO 8-P phosphatase)
VTDLAAFQPALRRVRLLVLDVDGVLTDGRLYYGARGESLKVFNVKDGHGIKQVAATGITVAIISGRKSAIVTRRARELGIRHVAQGVGDKLAALNKLAKSQSVPLEHCACVGDDTPDAPMLRAAGLAIAVADAHPDARAAADLLTTRAGGHGAVREVCDWLIDARRMRA